MSQEEILEIGNRVIHMARLFLTREGFTKEDDKLPERFHKPHTDGPIAGKGITKEELRKSLDVYYELMNWDSDGVPSEEVVRDYGLEKYM